MALQSKRILRNRSIASSNRSESSLISGFCSGASGAAFLAGRRSCPSSCAFKRPSRHLRHNKRNNHRANMATMTAIRTVEDSRGRRSEEHTSELQSLMRISYAVFCLKKKKDRTHSRQKQHKQNVTKVLIEK